MRQLDPVQSRFLQRLGVGALTAIVHVVFLLLLLQPSGHRLGLPEPPALTQLSLLENAVKTQREAPFERDASLPVMHAAELATLEPPRVPEPTAPVPPAAIPAEAAEVAPSPPMAALVAAGIEPLPEAPATASVSTTERTALAQQLTRLASEVLRAPRAQVTFELDGKPYHATLTREPLRDGSALERVTAEVTTTDGARQLTARVGLKRLAFSQFTQMVDRWDPGVQMHDDEIIGRFHSNSRLRLAYDASTHPKFLGKVTTAARGFDSDGFGRRRDAEIFAGGIETRSDRIRLPKDLQPLAGPVDSEARIHRFSNDTRIRFYPDGTYTWQTRGVGTTGYARESSKQPIYCIGAPGADLFVQGVVAGKVLLYSPQRIVIEGNLTYAHDPRGKIDAPDYLGLVSDNNIEIAPANVTGPGDLEIHAALFAGRRFVVTDIDYRRSATLRIYGSVAAGSLSASEPRYATKIEYDARFERQRPPGFPSTNRFELDAGDIEWVEPASESTP